MTAYADKGTRHNDYRQQYCMMYVYVQHALCNTLPVIIACNELPHNCLVYVWWPVNN